MRVLVTGGKGDLGRRLVPRLEERGHDVRVGTRLPRRENEFRFDLKKGLDEGELKAGDTVVHLASDSFHPDEDVRGSAQLFEAAGRAGASHVVYMSIVGVDAHPFRYYQAKREIEQDLVKSGLPYSILRATQFHSFIARLVDEIGGRLRIVPVPGGIPVRPVDADAVADRLVELVEAGPSGRVKDLAGPDVLELDRMVRDYLDARRRRWLRLPVPAWGKAVAGFRRGLQLGDEVEIAGRPYARYLDRP